MLHCGSAGPGIYVFATNAVFLSLNFPSWDQVPCGFHHGLHRWHFSILNLLCIAYISDATKLTHFHTWSLTNFKMTSQTLSPEGGGLVFLSPWSNICLSSVFTFDQAWSWSRKNFLSLFFDVEIDHFGLTMGPRANLVFVWFHWSVHDFWFLHSYLINSIVCDFTS